MFGSNKGANTVDVVGVQTGEVFFFVDEESPAPGDSFVIGYDFYEPGDVTPGSEIGSGNILCTFSFGPPVCTAVHTLDGRGEIHISSLNTGPPATGGAIVGGTGAFRNAGGEITVTLEGTEAPGDVVHVSHRLTWGRG